MSLFRSTLAEAYGKTGQAKEGLTVLTEALTMVNRTGEHGYEAELYRLKGTLKLQSQTGLEQVLDKSENPSPQHPTPSLQTEAEGYFLKAIAIAIAQKQQAKSLELRASTSLARLWQQQGKRAEGHKLLSDVYK